MTASIGPVTVGLMNHLVLEPRVDMFRRALDVEPLTGTLKPDASLERVKAGQVAPKMERLES